MADPKPHSIMQTKNTPEGESVVAIGMPPRPEQDCFISDHNGSGTMIATRLSAISKKYDINGDGTLDDAERAMREMDTSNRGYLTNEKVYHIVQRQMAMQEKLFGMKRVLVFLSIFTFFLALSNLATAWAAAVLAKETSVNSKGEMMSKDGTNMIGTLSKAEVYDATPKEESNRRDLELYRGTGTSFEVNGHNLRDALKSCSTTIRFRVQCSVDYVKYVDYDCSNSVAKHGSKTFESGYITAKCHATKDECTVSGFSCPQTGAEPAQTFLQEGEECFDGQECASGLCGGGSDTTSGVCVAGTCDDQYSGSSCDPNTYVACNANPQCCLSAEPYYSVGCECDANGKLQCFTASISLGCAYEWDGINNICVPKTPTLSTPPTLSTGTTAP